MGLCQMFNLQNKEFIIIWNRNHHHPLHRRSNNHIILQVLFHFTRVRRNKCCIQSRCSHTRVSHLFLLNTCYQTIRLIPCYLSRLFVTSVNFRPTHVPYFMFFVGNLRGFHSLYFDLFGSCQLRFVSLSGRREIIIMFLQNFGCIILYIPVIMVLIYLFIRKKTLRFVFSLYDIKR